MKQAIAIFAKPPLPGHTKSRLAADTSDEFAADLSAAMLTDLLCEAKQTDADTLLFHPPEHQPADFGGIERLADMTIAQDGNDLGERMLNCFRHTIENSGYERVVLIGSDCITHSHESMTDALTALETHDLVIQPADDGGYVLIGATRPIPSLFSGIDWGTDKVWNQTTNRLTGDINYVILLISFDIDDISDLSRLKEFCEVNSRPHTRDILEKGY
jgi:rSAM/selenodomain-associated transferase 1